MMVALIRESLDVNRAGIIVDPHHLPRFDIGDVVDAHVVQHDALGRHGEDTVLLSVAERPNAERIAGGDEVAVGVEEHDVVSAVQVLCEFMERADERRLRFTAQSVRYVMYQNLGVDVVHHVISALVREVISQRGVVGEIAVKPEGKPFPRSAVGALEGLRVLGLVAAARCVPNVPDGGGAGYLAQHRACFSGMCQPEHFTNGAGVLVRHEPVGPVGVERGDAGAELPSMLEIEQRRRNEVGYGLLARTIEVIDADDTTLVAGLVRLVAEGHARGGVVAYDRENALTIRSRILQTQTSLQDRTRQAATAALRFACVSASSTSNRNIQRCESAARPHSPGG